jgi:hypothetical protein
MSEEAIYLTPETVPSAVICNGIVYTPASPKALGQPHEAVADALDMMLEHWVQGTQPSDEQGKQATSALMALKRSAPPPPPLHREPIEADIDFLDALLDCSGDCDKMLDVIQRHRLAFSTPAAREGEGMAFVPLQPTDAMFEAAAKAWDGALSTYWAQEMWHAMIEAATPSTEGRKGEGQHNG